MLLIGLTGGIGCGKTAVAELFAEQGVPVIDADQVAREVVAPGEAALKELCRHFGDDVLLADGRLDRGRLREIVFHDQQARLELEAILHPRIRKQMQQQLADLVAPYAILAIPLLLETGQQELVDRILVVDCPPDQQIRRVCTRDGGSPSQARGILRAQCSRQDRLSAADDIIDNAGPQTQLRPQVLQLHRKYLALAAAL